MSSSIWTQCGGSSNVHSLRAAAAHRVVEAQYVNSTRKLVDTDAEQSILEDLLDGAKPTLRSDCAGLHYLLATPFRYPPLRNGSRFGTRQERGIWYAAESLSTACAERAYYALLFLEGTKAELGTLTTPLTIFTVPIKTKHGVDLSDSAFASSAALLEHKSSYAATQAVGSAMRADGVSAFAYRSARDPKRGKNFGLISPTAFAAKEPTHSEAWVCISSASLVEISERNPLKHPGRTLAYPRKDFEVDGRLPAPAV